MVVKIYISGISGNKEVKKRQQRVCMILESKGVGYDVIDITEPGREADKDFMQTKSTSNGATIGDQNPRHPLPPQIFNDESYCGDYDQFDMANEIDELEIFLKVSDAKKSEPEPIIKSQTPPKEVINNGPSEDATNGHVIEESHPIEDKAEEEIEEEDAHEEVEEEVEDETNDNNKNDETTTNEDQEVEGDVAA